MLLLTLKGGKGTIADTTNNTTSTGTYMEVKETSYHPPHHTGLLEPEPRFASLQLQPRGRLPSRTRSAV